LPVGGACHDISGSNQIDSEPRCFSAVLYEGQFLVLYFVGDQLLMLASYHAGFTQGIPHLICATKPFVPLSKTGAELLFELISQRYERGSTLITSNLPFEEWTETFGTERLTGALLDRLTHHVNILEMNGESYRLNQSKSRQSKT
jgi:DNA replication protein